jgi:transcriptional regulator with XRE-family HTH domain
VHEVTRYIFRVVSWRQIQAEYLRLVVAATAREHITQDQIARNAGLDKNYISKLVNLSATSEGPSITHLLKALRGVGIAKASEFFALVEQRAAGHTPPELAVTAVPDEEAQLEREAGRLALKLHRLAAASHRPSRRGRPRKPRL